MNKNNAIVPIAALSLGILAFLMPCSAPLAIAVGSVVVLGSKNAMGKVMGGLSVAMGVVSIVLMILSMLGLLGLQGGIICCSVCGSMSSGQ